MILLPDFMWLSFLAAIPVGLLSAPLGAVLLWKRMAYFGDALAHAALLGVALSAVFSFLDPLIAIILVSLCLTPLLYLLEQRTILPPDTLLSVVSNTSLALGVVILSALPYVRSDLFSYLFGDILNIDLHKIYFLYLFSFAVGAFLFWRWPKLLMCIIHEELAQIDGINVAREKLFFNFSLALWIAISVQMLGVLLIMALLIIPVATCTAWANTTKQLIFGSMLLSITAIFSGIFSSWLTDWPTGPMIVICAAFIFLVSYALKEGINRTC